MADLATLRTAAKSFKKTVNKGALDKLKSKKQTKAHNNPGDAGAPHVTSGEILNDSRGYSFLRASKAYMTSNWENAKLEKSVHDTLVRLGYPCDGGVLVPLDPMQLAHEEFEFMKMDLPQVVAKGVGAADPDRVRWMYETYKMQEFAKALGGDNDAAGGFLVQPDRMGSIIDLLRDASLLSRTAITEMTLPRSGRLEMSKTINDVSWQYVAENTDIDSLGLTDPSLGQVNLIAKTAVGLAKLSNQLINDGSPSAEAWVRGLYATSGAEDINNTLLNGTGTNGQPRGIMNNPGKTIRVAGTVGANGDTLKPEDVAQAVSDVGEVNGVFQGWIMRPVMTSAIRNKRADAVSGGDKAGAFLFVEANGANPAMLQGYPIAESTKVSKARVKGSGTTLTSIIGGMLSQVIYGRMATMELRSSDVAGTAFQNNQTWIRAIRRDDVQIRIPSTIVVIDNLLQV